MASVKEDETRGEIRVLVNKTAHCSAVEMAAANVVNHLPRFNGRAADNFF